MKKILCPTDFSDAAHNAIAYAAKLAQVTHSELTLLNVQSEFDLTPADVLRGKAMHIAGVTEHLEAQCREVTRAFKISCSADVESGARPLSSVIHDKAAGYDLIVMGSDGPDDLYQFFSGSNTYNALVKAEVPLLLVPAGYGYQDISQVVYAFDYLRERDLPLKRFMPILRSLKCKLTILQVMEESYSQEAEEELKELQHLIRNFYRYKPALKFDSIRSAEIAQGINRYVLDQQPDALALCSAHRTMIGRLFHTSVIKHITAYSQYPVFVFHE